MAREFKSTPQFIKAVKDREVTGIFSVFDNLDSYNDRMKQGSFTKTIQERSGQFLHLWQHDLTSPPTAVVKSVREIGRDELPADVLRLYPEASGGAEVTREYLNTARADEVLTNIKADVPLQMSFGFDVVKYDFEELPGAKYEWDQIRNVREVRLYETSDVLWGANDATQASKMPLDQLLRQLNARIQQIKAGARHSSKDGELINQIAAAAIELGATNIALIDEPDDDTQADSDKSRAATALTLQRARLFLMDAV